MNFDFFMVPRVLVQRGGLQRLGEWAAGLGQRVLLVHNAPAVADKAVEKVRAAGLSCELYRQQGEPTVAGVAAALAQARAGGCNLLIGLGGGSAMDTAKATAALLANGGEPLDYMEVVGLGKKITRPSVPWIAIPTTAGTGAEATRNAVVGYHEKQFKASIRSEHMLSRLVLLDAELAVGVSPQVTAASGADALCQVVESYTSIQANPLTDAMALQGIALAGRSLRRAYDQGNDLDAREEMGIAALLSGIALGNAGLGAVHGFAAPLGGCYPVPHGVVCAALLPLVVSANVKALRQRQPQSEVLTRYATVGRVLTGQRQVTDEVAIDAAISFIQTLVAHMQIPRLREFGIKEQAVPQIVPLARKSSSMRYNPIVLNDQELAGILQGAI